MTAVRRAVGAWIGAIPLLVVVFLCLVAPAAMLFARAFVTDAGIGLDRWSAVLDQASTRQAVATSLGLGVTCAVISALVGTPVAWLVSRMLARPRAGWLGLFNVAAHFGGIGLAFAYVATLGAFGMLTLFIQGLGVDFQPPGRASFTALVITYEYANIPLFVLLTVPAMGILRAEWSEAAQMAAATRFQFWRRVGLPVLMPFILAGFILSFTWAIGIYGIAFALAGDNPQMPIRLITLQIGHVLADDAVNGSARAGLLSVLLVVIALVALVTYRWLMRRGLRWFGGHSPIEISSSESQKAARQGRRSPGRIALFALVATYIALPIGAVALYSVATRWTDHALPDGYTLQYWLATATDPLLGAAVANSLSLGILTTVLVLALVIPAVYWARTVNPRIRVVLEFSAAIPFALPFLVIGLALLQFAGVFAPGLQGTYPLLLAGYVAVTFPFVYWAVDGAMAAAGVERLSQAAAACGASQFQTLRRVVLPNIKTGLATGGMLAFATVMGEFAMVTVLASSVNTLPIWTAQMLRDRAAGGLAPVAVVTTAMFAVLFVLSALVAGVARRQPGIPVPVVTETGLGELA